MLLALALSSGIVPASARPWTAAELAVAESWIAGFDEDRDGRLSAEEFPCFSVLPGGQCNAIDQMLNAELYDRNGDNFVTREEWLAVNTRSRDVTRDRRTERR